MTWRLGKVPMGVLAIDGLVVVALLWFAFHRSFGASEVLAPAVAPAPAVKAAPAKATELLTLAAFRNRPLFAANRKAATPEEIAAAEAAEAAKAVPPPPPVLTGYRLSGTLVGGGKKIAFVQPEGSAEATSVAVGGSVDGWQLIDVDARQAVFELQGNRTVLSFMLDGGTGGESPGTGAAGPGSPPAPRHGISPKNSDGPGKPSKARLYRPPKRQ